MKASLYLKQDLRFTNLYVKHFPLTWTHKDLDNVFKHYGTIVSKILKMYVHPTWGRRGVYACVKYEDHKSAETVCVLKRCKERITVFVKCLKFQAIDKLHKKNAIEEDDSIRLYVQRCKSRGERMSATKKKYQTIVKNKRFVRKLSYIVTVFVGILKTWYQYCC